VVLTNLRFPEALSQRNLAGQFITMKSVIIKIVFALYTLSPIPVLLYFSSVPMVYYVPVHVNKSQGGTMNTNTQATGEQLMTGQQRGLVIEPLPAPVVSTTKNHSYTIKTPAGQWHAPGMGRSDRAR
jgi:hypothetical protein